MKYQSVEYDKTTEFNIDAVGRARAGWKLEFFNSFATIGYNYRIVALWSRDESIAL